MCVGAPCAALLALEVTSAPAKATGAFSLLKRVEDGEPDAFCRKKVPISAVLGTCPLWVKS